MEENRTVIQEWVARRVAAVREAYSPFDVLMERGIQDIPDKTTPAQIACPFHGVDHKPSARFYPAGSGRNYDIVRCFKCKENWDCINLHAKFKGIKFMEALVELERRFRIRVPKRPEAPEFTEPTDRGANYISDKWDDVPRVLILLETKLIRLRDKVPLTDYVKFCRVLDTVQWDLDRAAGKQTPDMVRILKRLRDVMDEALSESQAVIAIQQELEQAS
jgi:hypothetical protein